ncbi:MAG: LacI family DNA-binding transcriptional regulator [Actinomycetaceae bacterium]|nr:LacI family DNA-binding transcriptional regulator [Actinomycetaceae bacterium]
MSKRSFNSVTLEDVAREALVSRATVSRVVRGSGGVKQTKVDAVQEAIKKLNYIPNRSARSLVTQKTDLIAVIIPENNHMIFADPFFSASISGVQDALETSDENPVIIFGNKDGDIDHVTHFLELGHVDGAIVLSHHRNMKQLQQFKNSSTPLVFIGRPDIGQDYSWVDIDNYDGGRQAAAYLHNKGAANLAIITGRLDMVAGSERARGFEDYCREHRISYIREIGSFTHQGAIEATRKLLTKKDQFDGLFVCSDLMSTGVLEVCQDKSIKIPDEFLLVSFDNSELSVKAKPQFTSLTNPAYELATHAVQMLRKLINNPQETHQLTLPVELVLRESA